MREKVKTAKNMAQREYGVKIKIEFRKEGFDIFVDEPIYYKAQGRMVRQIEEILGQESVELYVM